MNFNSLHYLLFLPVVLLVFRLLPHRFRWILLLAASYYFYLSWNVTLGFLILATTLITYGGAVAINKTQSRALKKFWLSVCCIICLGILVFFKYIDFLIDGVCSVIRLFIPSLESPALNLILPIGISFYTFQSLSYVIDVYRGKFTPERHFGYYALFISFFPQLVAGPIERPSDLLPQLRAEHKFNAEDTEVGIRFLLCGFFRKCVVADFCGKFVDGVFGNLQQANSLAIALGGLLFLVQMYNDFAGYSEIAIGTARLFGIRLSRNFDKPLTAVGFRDFFRRWHITLTRWFTDYVYIPLGGSRRGKVRRIFNTFVVFSLCGLWHGANWTYLIWGLYAAFFISLETLCAKPAAKLAEKLHISVTSAPLTYARRVIFLLLCIPSALLFRSTDLSEGFLCIAKLFNGWGAGEEYFDSALNVLGIQAVDLILIVLCLGCLYFLSDFAYEQTNALQLPLNEDGYGALSREAAIYWYFAVAIALGWFILLAQSGSGVFAYFQF